MHSPGWHTRLAHQAGTAGWHGRAHADMREWLLMEMWRGGVSKIGQRRVMLGLPHAAFIGPVPVLSVLLLFTLAVCFPGRYSAQRSKAGKHNG